MQQDLQLSEPPSASLSLYTTLEPLAHFLFLPHAHPLRIPRHHYLLYQALRLISSHLQRFLDAHQTIITPPEPPSDLSDVMGQISLTNDPTGSEQRFGGGYGEQGLVQARKEGMEDREGGERGGGRKAGTGDWMRDAEVAGEGENEVILRMLWLRAAAAVWSLSILLRVTQDRHFPEVGQRLIETGLAMRELRRVEGSEQREQRSLATGVANGKLQRGMDLRGIMGERRRDTEDKRKKEDVGAVGLDWLWPGEEEREVEVWCEGEGEKLPETLERRGREMLARMGGPGA